MQNTPPENVDFLIEQPILLSSPTVVVAQPMLVCEAVVSSPLDSFFSSWYTFLNGNDTES